jgi:uncharacterized protein YcaQ
MVTTLDDLRRFTVAHNFFKPLTLKLALRKMGFLQADPIRAPARAQDLILRHRVRNYHAGDLERLYPTLNIEEDYFINYGYVTRAISALMHPRSDTRVNGDGESPRPSAQKRKARVVLDFVRERGTVHPREVDEHFSHGKVKNYWGGLSNATTHLMDDLHYRGALRIARRERGIRIYEACQHDGPSIDDAQCRSRIDSLVDVVVRIYAPLTASSLSYYVRRLRYAVPQWRQELTGALQRARGRLSHARVGGVDWYWPVGENPDALNHEAILNLVRLLAPFDPVVHDRARFELLWGWVYRFEAYTPALKRKLGYYAMPMLWGDRMIGWANISVKNATLDFEFGYVKSQPRDRVFKRELEAELNRLKTFLGSD